MSSGKAALKILQRATAKLRLKVSKLITKFDEDSQLPRKPNFIQII